MFGTILAYLVVVLFWRPLLVLVAAYWVLSWLLETGWKAWALVALAFVVGWWMDRQGPMPRPWG